MFCLWKSQKLDMRVLATYIRVTVNKRMDKFTFTLSQAIKSD